MEIRSYRRVFDLERRIYRIDRVRLNPAGIPVRGVVYFLIILAAALVAARLPLLATIASLPPWYLSDLALPAMSAALLTVIRVEGRPFHIAAHALVRYRTGTQLLGHLRPCPSLERCWRPGEIIFLPDGSDARLRRMRYRGPGGALIAIEHELNAARSEPGSSGLTLGRHGPLIMRELAGRRLLSRRRVIALAPGAQLLVRQTQTREKVKP